MSLVGLLVLTALVACAPSDEDVVVFAAASLQGAFVEVAESFEAGHPEVDVVLSFAGSSLLAAQIARGAPADVFAAADRAQMDAVVRQGRVSSPLIFATNQIVLVVPAGDPASIEDAADLARPGVRVVLGAREVPVGAYARAFLRSLGVAEAVEENVVSNETDVKEVLSKVRLGEADAGIVYRTDVTSGVAGDVETILLDAPPAAYPIALSTGAGREAAGFVDFLTSPEAGRILEKHGFGAP
jgi:molybdate transport system substrate-binding protein